MAYAKLGLARELYKVNTRPDVSYSEFFVMYPSIVLSFLRADLQCFHVSGLCLLIPRDISLFSCTAYSGSFYISAYGISRFV